MERICIDESCWPLVIVRYPKRIDDADFEAHLARVTRFVRRAEPWGMLNDSRGAGHPSAKQRKDIVRMYEENEAAVRAHWRGTAVIFDSRVIVGVITAMTWLKAPIHPFQCFTDYDEGLRWVAARLPAGAVQLPRRASSF